MPLFSPFFHGPSLNRFRTRGTGTSMETTEIKKNKKDEVQKQAGTLNRPVQVKARKVKSKIKDADPDKQTRKIPKLPKKKRKRKSSRGH